MLHGITLRLWLFSGYLSNRWASKVLVSSNEACLHGRKVQVPTLICKSTVHLPAPSSFMQGYFLVHLLVCNERKCANEQYTIALGAPRKHNGTVWSWYQAHILLFLGVWLFCYLLYGERKYLYIFSSIFGTYYDLIMCRKWDFRVTLLGLHRWVQLKLQYGLFITLKC